MIYWILIIIIIICLAVIFYIIFPKFSKVALVDISKAPILQQKEIKKKILEQRFARHLQAGTQKAASSLEPVFKKIDELVKSWYRRLLDLEEWYKHKALHASFKDKVDRERYTGQLLTKADEEVGEEKFNDAERKYFEVLKIDERNTEAYKGLGYLYFLKKDYEHAREIYEFLLKLNLDDPVVYRNLGEIASYKGDLKGAEEKYRRSLELDQADLQTYLDLAEVYLNLDDSQKAFDLANKAVALEPNNPRSLDFLLQVSIIVRDKDVAFKAWRQLKETNPENQKLAELKEQIN